MRSQQNKHMDTRIKVCNRKSNIKQPNTIHGIVSLYRQHCLEHLDTFLQSYSTLSKLEDVITHASCAHMPPFNSYPKRHPHQRRLRKSTLSEIYKQLQLIRFSGYNTFSGLYDTIEKQISPIYGAGPVMIYDTSLRIGAFLKLKPELIYLHAGARSGAKALGIPGNRITLNPLK